MSREETKPRFKPWLLALALAAILGWYVINPVPVPIHFRNQEDDPPDIKRRKVRTQADDIFLSMGEWQKIPTSATPVPVVTEEDLPDWPQYIELD